MSAIASVKAQLVSVLGGLFPAPVLVSYGNPGSYQPDVIVGVHDVRVKITRPTMSTARPREEAAEIDVRFSVYVAMGDTAQQQATETAVGMLTTFSNYFKTRPNETLGGTCREAWVSSYELTEDVAVDPEMNVAGRLAEIVAVVSFATRI